MAGDPGPAPALIRAFLAIDIPPAEDGGPLVRLAGPVPNACERQLLTLRYFKALSSVDVERLKKQCRRIKSRPFKVVVQSPRLFDRSVKFKHLWAEVEGGRSLKRLCILVRQAALRAFGKPLRPRLLPHVTLAWPKEDFANLTELVKRAEGPLAEFEATELKLYRSTPTPDGPNVHEVLAAWPLALARKS